YYMTIIFFSIICFVFFIIFIFFFLMLRRPPTSTLFPTRRSSDLGKDESYFPYALPDVVVFAKSTEEVRDVVNICRRHRVPMIPRSEEHTSELQSQSNLVCRLLLEKKKKTTKHRKQQKNNKPNIMN